MVFFKNTKQLITLTLLISVVVSICYPVSVKAKTVEEIQQEIAAQQAELDKINAQIDTLNKTLADNKAKQSSSNSQLGKLQGLIATSESQLNLYVLQLQQIDSDISIKSLQKDQIEKEQNVQVVNSYIDWKTANGNVSLNEDLLKQVVYNNVYQGSIHGQILKLADELNQLNSQKATSEEQKNEINKGIADLTVQKDMLQKEVDAYNKAVADANADLRKQKANSANITQTINSLGEEQQNLNQGNGTGGTDTLLPGEFYFAGTGRDLIQGHALGFSQWGAMGAAYNKGWNAEQILTFYYSNVHIETRQINKTIPDKGIDVETYVKGLGEVPDKACGTLAQDQAWRQGGTSLGWAANDPRFNKYVVVSTDGSPIDYVYWGTRFVCWPEETIKAQVIAARSYAWATNSGGGQVFKGGDGKAWAAYETVDKYIIFNGDGSVIKAFYSADNNQGYGTSDYATNTIFGCLDYDGIRYLCGSKEPQFIKHVDDTAFAYRTSEGRWQWRTNGYTLVDFNNMFTYAATHYCANPADSCSHGGSHPYLSSLKQRIGTIQNVTLHKDSSNRVQYVTLIGDSGTGTVNGGFFKDIWNDWVIDNHTSDKQDYIYSGTFTFQQK